MKPEHENAVRAAARRCAEELRAAMRVKPKPVWDKVCLQILRKHHQQVAPLGVKLYEFYSVIGRMNDRYGVRK
ncbi:hypothetical protein [Kluyvera sp. CRP]|uniref:hypothetical protein n=1 Tax=Kluyvera sp. CRP TaxID=2873269 RepID=UPI001CC1F3E4|nr:hypothetical protein [Kluyvera sp. CRP]UAK18637.1 hypothetical protein K7B04_14980 [Kluyvera sp. CRP]